jgi:hypothetical protein
MRDRMLVCLTALVCILGWVFTISSECRYWAIAGPGPPASEHWLLFSALSSGPYAICLASTLIGRRSMAILIWAILIGAFLCVLSGIELSIPVDHNKIDPDLDAGIRLLCVTIIQYLASCALGIAALGACILRRRA